MEDGWVIGGGWVGDWWRMGGLLVDDGRLMGEWETHEWGNSGGH